jgi:hypothetical protein
VLLIEAHTNGRHNHSFPNSSFMARIMKLEGGTSDILGDLIGSSDCTRGLSNYDPEIGRGQYRNHLTPSLLASSEPRYRDSGEVIGADVRMCSVVSQITMVCRTYKLEISFDEYRKGKSPVIFQPYELMIALTFSAIRHGLRILSLKTPGISVSQRPCELE